MPNFETTPIPYVPIADKAAEVRLAIDAARLSAANSFGGLQKLAIPGPFATDAEANTFGVPDDNLYYRSDGTVRAASHISLDLAFALDKTLTARTGPTPTFSRASSGLFVNANGILVGKTTGTTVSLDPTTTTVGTTEVTVTVASGSVVGWLVGQSVSLIVDSNANNAPDTGELWLVGDIVSTTATQLVFKVTSKGTTSASATDWTLGYRGARFDHDATGVCKGLLIEESRSNTLKSSESFVDSSPWAGSGANITVTPDTDIAPSGILTADKLTVGATTTTYLLTQVTPAFVSGSVYTVSCFFKADQVTRVALYATTTATFPANAIFDLTGSGSVVQNSFGTASIVQYPNGWYRCQITGTAGANIPTSIRISPVTGTSLNYPGNSVDSFYAWGAQLEVGAFPTSYIPTTSGTAARSADVCSIIGTDFSSFYNQSEGTLFARYSVVAGFSITGRTVPVCAISNQSFNEAIRIGSPTSNLNMAFDTVASSIQTRILATSPISLIGSNTAAGAYKINDSGLSSNSATTLSGSPASITTLVNRFDIGGLHPGSAVLPLNGHIARIQYFRKRLSNAKLQTLTAP